MLKKAVQAVKDAVTVEGYLADRGVEIKHSRARCIVHGGDNPQSFSINPEKQVWHCFRCQAGGDLITLVQAVEGGGPWEAVVALGERYAVKLPGRSETWHKNQNTKAAIRDEMRRGLTKVYQRRFYKMLHDPGAHPEDDEALWDGMYKPAYLAATRRVFG
jgi:DNA primase